MKQFWLGLTRLLAGGILIFRRPHTNVWLYSLWMAYKCLLALDSYRVQLLSAYRKLPLSLHPEGNRNTYIYIYIYIYMYNMYYILYLSLSLSIYIYIYIYCTQWVSLPGLGRLRMFVPTPPTLPRRTCAETMTTTFFSGHTQIIIPRGLGCKTLITY